MARTLTGFAAAVAAVALLVAPANAVLGGSTDGNGHPYVGMSVFFKNGVPIQRCSGTLVSPTIYITAGHCTGIDAADNITPDHAEIWFSPGPIPRGNWPGGVSCAGYSGYPCHGDVGGTPHPHPGWSGYLTLPDIHDTGVVVLDRPWNLSSYAQLAPKGYLDDLATKRGRQSVNFTMVGYGVQFERPNLEIAMRTRYVGTNQLVNLTSALAGGNQLVMTDANGNGTGGGGTCFGDSGGPVFHTSDSGQTYLVADISFGTKYCKGTSGAYRLDTDSARNFLAGYVSLP